MRHCEVRSNLNVSEFKIKRDCFVPRNDAQMEFQFNSYNNLMIQSGNNPKATIAIATITNNNLWLGITVIVESLLSLKYMAIIILK